MAQPDFTQARRTVYLITRFIDGSIDFAELQELESWRKERPRNEALFQKSTNKEKLAEAVREMQSYDTEGSLEKLMQTIKKQDAKRKVVILLWQKLLAVACVTVLIGALIFFYNERSNINPNAVLKPRPQFIPAGTNKAILTLANGKKINLDDTQNGTIAKQAGAVIQKHDDGLIAYIPSVTQNNIDTITEYNLIETPRGGQYRLQLPDGTKVWLNAASSLKYPSSFKGRQREVILTGEGYFEVVHNARQPFIVKTSTQSIKDIGTSFNVNAYNDEPHIATTLVEGSVQISAGPKSTILKPGHQAVNISGNIKVSSVDLGTATAWKDGRIAFSRTDLRSVLRQISRWYNIDVEYQGNVPDETITGEVSRKADLSAMLEILRLSDIHYIQDGHKLTIKP